MSAVVPELRQIKIKIMESPCNLFSNWDMHIFFCKK